MHRQHELRQDKVHRQSEIRQDKNAHAT
jgi:hypothetical protein